MLGGSEVTMYTHPPTTAFIILSIVGILILASIPIIGFALYQQPEVTSPQADTVGDAKINEQNDTLDTQVPED
jgi:hypothetical protein